MDFHSPSLSDREWVQKAFSSSRTDCCEYCFGNIYMWSDIYNNKISNIDGIFVSADFSDNPVFCYPIGNGDKKAVIKALIEYAKSLGTVLSFYGLTEADKLELESLFPEKFEFDETRDFFDYLYRAYTENFTGVYYSDAPQLNKMPDVIGRCADKTFR